MSLAALLDATEPPARTQTATTCFHCGEPLGTAPVGAAIDGQPRQFCCAGCAAAADWIHAARLDDYYQLRSSPAGHAPETDIDLAAWDRPEMMAAYQRAVAGGTEVVLLTDGMRCAACAWLIDRALAREPGVREVVANAVTGRIRIVWNPARNPLSSILRRLNALGYRPYLAGTAEQERVQRAERHRWLLRLGLAGIASLQAMMFAEALYLDGGHQMPAATRDFFRWLTFLIATPVIFYAGLPFLAGAWRELRERRAGLDLLVGGATVLAWAASTVEMLRGGPHVWFDTAVMFVFLLLVARALEEQLRRVARARIDALARAAPVLADREAGGRVQAVPATQLAAGDVVRVAAGAHLPADAVLLDQPATFDESLLSGEARPIPRQVADAVLAGSVPVDRPVRIRVTATGAATQLSLLTRLVLRAQEHRPRVARAADRIASVFVLAIAVTAAAVYLYWHATDPARAFDVALAVLVISCPCALALAVPTALTAAYSNLSRRGVLVCRPDALETLARIDTVVFDKTGTLGDGQWRILSTEVFGGCSGAEALHLAAALERDSRHPLACAFRTHDDGRPTASPALHAGRGLEACVAGQRLYLGTAGLAAGRADDGALWLGDGRTAIARFELREQPRPDAAATLRRLQALGLELHLLSGDGAAAVAQFIATLDVPLASQAARQLPADKLDYVRRLQAQGRTVAMVGDGINDAPVLAGADVSLAVAGGAALAQQSADLVLLNPALAPVAAAVQVARRARRIMLQNFAWAIGYNLAALPLAAAGWVEPWAAALAMVISSLTVTLNALRLARRTA